MLLDADDIDEALDCALSSDGRVAVAGRFKGTMDFDSDRGSLGTVTSAGDWDAYVALIEADGTVAWGKSLGGTGDDQATGVENRPTMKAMVQPFTSESRSATRTSSASLDTRNIPVKANSRPKDRPERGIRSTSARFIAGH